MISITTISVTATLILVSSDNTALYQENRSQVTLNIFLTAQISIYRQLYNNTIFGLSTANYDIFTSVDVK